MYIRKRKQTCKHCFRLSHNARLEFEVNYLQRTSIPETVKISLKYIHCGKQAIILKDIVPNIDLPVTCFKITW